MAIMKRIRTDPRKINRPCVEELAARCVIHFVFTAEVLRVEWQKHSQIVVNRDSPNDRYGHHFYIATHDVRRTRTCLHMKHIICLGAALLLAPAPTLAQDCFDLAARHQGVNSTVLRAIAMMENPRCDARTSRNTNGSVDVGCMQINSVHLRELARHGVFPHDLLDQCKNIHIGAWHYKKMVRKYGNTWNAIGAYHSETPHLRDRYARGVYNILRKYGYL